MRRRATQRALQKIPSATPVLGRTPRAYSTAPRHNLKNYSAPRRSLDRSPDHIRTNTPDTFWGLSSCAVRQDRSKFGEIGSTCQNFDQDCTTSAWLWSRFDAIWPNLVETWQNLAAGARRLLDKCFREYARSVRGGTDVAESKSWGLVERWWSRFVAFVQ